MNLLLQFVTCTIRTFLAKFTLLNSVDGDIVSNKLEFSTARAKIVKNIIIFISNVCCTPTLKEVEGGGWSRGKSGAFVNFSFEFSYLSSVSRSFISSVRSSNSHPGLLLIHHPPPLFQITLVLNTGLSLSEPLQLYKGYNAI